MSGSLPLLAPLGLLAVVVVLFLFRASPRATFVAWSLVVFFVPIWIGATVGFFWAAVTLVTIAAIAANLTDVRLTPVDGLVAMFAVLVLVLLALDLATLSASVIAILQWVIPYIWGRLVLARVGELFLTRTIAVVATAAAALAIVEFVTRSNVFVLVPGPGAFAEWSALQPRASFLRAEGAFGHSIALGASLAMATAFIVAARWRPPATLLALVLVVGAIVVTFSRIGLFAAGLTIALSIVLLPGIDRGLRWAVAAAGAAGVAVVAPFVIDVFADAGDEAGGSAQYRSGLLSLLTEVQLVGTGDDWAGEVADGVYLGSFTGSVDNTLLLIALRFGWIPALLVVAVLASIVIGMVRQRSNPAAIAVAAQVPTLFAVALITQFGMLLWFLVGLAVAWHALDRDRGTGGTPGALRLPVPPRRERISGARASAARTT